MRAKLAGARMKSEGSADRLVALQNDLLSVTPKRDPGEHESDGVQKLPRAVY
jgi:hypothetical protein